MHGWPTGDWICMNLRMGRWMDGWMLIGPTDGWPTGDWMCWWMVQLLNILIGGE